MLPRNRQKMKARGRYQIHDSTDNPLMAAIHIYSLNIFNREEESVEWMWKMLYIADSNKKAEAMAIAIELSWVI
ncbi:unnamed protein product [Periconia digitata]|uniref:Uncharacterized protein n=1 Tax=Periconia digitata TaxID=1303443 RepID=A0A9W4U5A2_9PLEO|nr:unnamed protein product [Periconia digitata]